MPPYLSSLPSPPYSATAVTLFGVSVPPPTFPPPAAVWISLTGGGAGVRVCPSPLPCSLTADADVGDSAYAAGGGGAGGGEYDGIGDADIGGAAGGYGAAADGDVIDYHPPPCGR